jgi:hypothetical protein
MKMHLQLDSDFSESIFQVRTIHKIAHELKRQAIRRCFNRRVSHQARSF